MHLENFASIKFKMATYQPLFIFTWLKFGKPQAARLQENNYKIKCEFSGEDAPWKFLTLIKFKIANNQHYLPR